MKKDKTLLDLPMLIPDRDMVGDQSTIGDTYINELAGVSSAEELSSFCQKWKNIHLLKWNVKRYENQTNKEEEAIVTGKFDAARVFYFLQNKRNEEVMERAFSAPEDPDARIMSHIAVPIALLQATIEGRRWGVGEDLIMFRLFN